MIRKTVVLKEILMDKIPCKDINVDFENISQYIINKYIGYEFEDRNYHRDIEMGFLPDIDRIHKFLNTEFRKHQWPSLVPIDSIANVHVFLEGSYKRNHINPFDYKKSPNLTCIVVVKGQGELIIEHPDYKQENAFSQFSFEQGDYFIFNSDLNYFTSKNTDRNKYTQLLINNYELI